MVLHAIRPAPQNDIETINYVRSKKIEPINYETLGATMSSINPKNRRSREEPQPVEYVSERHEETRKRKNGSPEEPQPPEYASERHGETRKRNRKRKNRSPEEAQLCESVSEHHEETRKRKNGSREEPQPLEYVSERHGKTRKRNRKRKNRSPEEAQPCESVSEHHEETRKRKNGSPEEPQPREPSERHEKPRKRSLKRSSQGGGVLRVRWIKFLNGTRPILLQQSKGPCSLIAICNVLLLSNNLNLSPDISEVSQNELLSLVEERLKGSQKLVHENFMADVMNLLPKLLTGIHVDVKFRRITDFGFTVDRLIFDLLDIPLFHGWIVDPKDETSFAIGSTSHDDILQAVDQRDKDKNGRLVRKFLSENPSQLTPYGFSQLRQGVGEHELCIFFYNNHFNTMFKHKGLLYTLVTEEGFVNEQQRVVWERIDKVGGAPVYVSSNFKKIASQGTKSKKGVDGKSESDRCCYHSSTVDCNKECIFRPFLMYDKGKNEEDWKLLREALIFRPMLVKSILETRDAEDRPALFHTMVRVSQHFSENPEKGPYQLVDNSLKLALDVKQMLKGLKVSAESKRDIKKCKKKINSILKKLEE